jgi:hypothetical protein
MDYAVLEARLADPKFEVFGNGTGVALRRLPIDRKLIVGKKA